MVFAGSGCHVGAKLATKTVLGAILALLATVLGTLFGQSSSGGELDWAGLGRSTSGGELDWAEVGPEDFLSSFPSIPLDPQI